MSWRNEAFLFTRKTKIILVLTFYPAQRLCAFHAADEFVVKKKK